MNEKVFGSKKQGSITDIPLPGNSLDLSEAAEQKTQPVSDGTQTNDWNRPTKKKQGGSRLVIALIVLGLVLLGYSMLFHSAQVDLVQQKTSAVIANQEFTANIQSGAGDLELIRVKPFARTETLHVAGSIEENRQTKTSGIITVYNIDDEEKNYVKNTRFQSPDGNIYRAFNRFVIPAGSSANPGSVEVLVVAENPGDKYNSTEGLSFVLPALKEQADPSFDLVYAEQTEPLMGGYSGVIRVPIEDDIEEAKIKLESRLSQALWVEFRDTLPDNYVIDETFTLVSKPEYTEQPNQEKGGVDLFARSELYAVVFRKDDFERTLARVLVDGYNDEDVDILNIDALTKELVSEDFDAETSDQLTFKITGEAQFVWPIDIEQVRTLIAGKLKSHIENGLVLGLDNVGIESVSVRPPWRRSLPGEGDRININIK